MVGNLAVFTTVFNSLNAKILYKEMKRKKIDNSITELSIFKDETSCAEARSAHSVILMCKSLK